MSPFLRCGKDIVAAKVQLNCCSRLNLTPCSFEAPFFAENNQIATSLFGAFPAL